MANLNQMQLSNGPAKARLKPPHERYFPYMLLAPTILVLVLLTVYPFVYSIFLSLHSWELGRPMDTMRWVGLKNFAEILTDESLWISIKNTLVFVVAAVSAEFLLGLGLALIAIRRIGIFDKLIRALLLLPMIVTPIVVGMVWRLLYNYELGMVNYFFGWFGIPPQTWLTNLKLVMPAVVVADVWQWTPFMFLMFLAGLSALPMEPQEAALVDGANFWQILWYVKLPLLRPIIFIALLLRTVDAIKTFDLVYIMTFGGPGNATEVFSLYAYRQGFLHSDLTYGATIALMLTIVITIASMIAVRRAYAETEV